MGSSRHHVIITLMISPSDGLIASSSASMTSSLVLRSHPNRHAQQGTEGSQGQRPCKALPSPPLAPSRQRRRA
eukprot:2720711-Prymnesium_polylepis.1